MKTLNDILQTVEDRMVLKVGEVYASNSKWLKAEDLGGKEHELIISEVKLMSVTNRDDNSKIDTKIELAFKYREKTLLLNKTNAASIASMHGDDAEEWVNKPITLYPTQVTFQNQTVAAIRVQVILPKADEIADGEDIPF